MAARMTVLGVLRLRGQANTVGAEVQVQCKWAEAATSSWLGVRQDTWVPAWGKAIEWKWKKWGMASEVGLIWINVVR